MEWIDGWGLGSGSWGLAGLTVSPLHKGFLPEFRVYLSGLALKAGLG